MIRVFVTVAAVFGAWSAASTLFVVTVWAPLLAPARRAREADEARQAAARWTP